MGQAVLKSSPPELIGFLNKGHCLVELVQCMQFFQDICWPGSTRFDPVRPGILQFHQNPANYLELCLKSTTHLSQPTRCHRRITAYRVAPLIQLQTHLISYNFFTPEKTLCFHQQWLNMNPETAGSEHNETVKDIRYLKVQTGRDRTKEIQLEAIKVLRVFFLKKTSFSQVFCTWAEYRFEGETDAQGFCSCETSLLVMEKQIAGARFDLAQPIVLVEKRHRHLSYRIRFRKTWRFAFRSLHYFHNYH